jgi:hypothetical protein
MSTTHEGALESRITHLERRSRYLMVACVVLALGAIALAARLSWYLGQRVTLTDTLVVPSAFILSPTQAGIAPATNGRSIELWLATSLPGATTRLELKDTGQQELRFIDARGRVRLRLGLSASGTPSLTALDEAGKVVWQAPPTSP